MIRVFEKKVPKVVLPDGSSKNIVYRIIIDEEINNIEEDTVKIEVEVPSERSDYINSEFKSAAINHITKVVENCYNNGKDKDLEAYVPYSTIRNTTSERTEKNETKTYATTGGSIRLRFTDFSKLERHIKNCGFKLLKPDSEKNQ